MSTFCAMFTGAISVQMTPFSGFMPTISKELKHEKYLSMFNNKIC